MITKIIFTDITFQFGKVEFTVRRCEECAGLVLDAEKDMQAHASWHDKVQTDTKMAGLGFGPLL